MKFVGQNIATKSYYGTTFTPEQLLTDFVNMWFSEFKDATPAQMAAYPANYNG